jgi:polyhydroxybutyrate depolymerase
MNRTARRVVSFPLWAAAVAATFAGCDPATDPISYDEFLKAEGEGELGIWVHSGLYNRTYTLHTPPDMAEEGSYPLLIFLHGGGATGRSFQSRLRADALTDAAGFITVYPDGLERSWTVGCGNCTDAERLGADDVTFLATLARHLAEHLPVDTTKVFVAGFSQGGSLAHLYACTSSLPAAGVATVAGLVFRDVNADCDPGRPLPVVIVHGTDDPVAWYGGFGLEAPLLSAPEGVEMWAREMGCQGPPVVTEIPDQVGDHLTVTTFEFTSCASGFPVVHHRINGGGHTWPGPTGPWGAFGGRNTRNLDATGEFIERFSAALGGF